jgi:hypothetical protein
MSADLSFYVNGSEHACDVCGEPIMTIFKDAACTERYDGDDVCTHCEDFGGPVDDMPDIYPSAYAGGG